MKTVLAAWKLMLLLLMGSLVTEAEHSVPDTPQLQRRMQVLACKGERRAPGVTSQRKNPQPKSQLLKSGYLNFIFGFGLYIKNCFYLLINLFSFSKRIHLNILIYPFALQLCLPRVCLSCQELQTLGIKNGFGIGLKSYRPFPPKHVGEVKLVLA